MDEKTLISGIRFGLNAGFIASLEFLENRDPELAREYYDFFKDMEASTDDWPDPFLGDYVDRIRSLTRERMEDPEEEEESAKEETGEENPPTSLVDSINKALNDLDSLSPKKKPGEDDSDFDLEMPEEEEPATEPERGAPVEEPAEEPEGDSEEKENEDKEPDEDGDEPEQQTQDQEKSESRDDLIFEYIERIRGTDPKRIWPPDKARIESILEIIDENDGRASMDEIYAGLDEKGTEYNQSSVTKALRTLEEEDMTESERDQQNRRTHVLLKEPEEDDDHEE